MSSIFKLVCLMFLVYLLPLEDACSQTELEISGKRFTINGEPTYPGRVWQGYSIEGLLLNVRMVQGIFDDLNPETRALWNYPDTGVWDPDRNTREFIEAMQQWRDDGLIAFTLNLQGGSPTGYGNKQWLNSAYDQQGKLRPDYMSRLKRILNRADELEMAVILGLFYFGQDQHLENEAAVISAVDNVISWLFEQGFKNVLIEVANESDLTLDKVTNFLNMQIAQIESTANLNANQSMENQEKVSAVRAQLENAATVSYDHAILSDHRVNELITRIKGMSRNGYRYLVSTSYTGSTIPGGSVISNSDYVLLHGNGVEDPERICEMIDLVRLSPGYRGQPIVFNEDDHEGFDSKTNNFAAALQCGAGWGYFDYRRPGEAFIEGYQSVPVEWSSGSDRKQAFWSYLREVTGQAQQ